MGEPNKIDAERLNPGTLWQRRDSGGNLGKELINPGKETSDLFMRTYVTDMDMVVDLVAFRDFIRDADIEEDEAIVRDLLELMTSIGGLSRDEYLQATAGLIREKKSLSIFGRKKGKAIQHDEQPNA